MENYWVVVAFLVTGYFLPAIIATAKDRPNKGAIWALNILGGWTVIGWIVAFIWSLTSGRPPAPTIVVNTASVQVQPYLTKQCPSCAETVLRDAKKCKHCGEVFVAPAAMQLPPPKAMGWCPGCGKLRGYDVSKCIYCGDASPMTAPAPS